MPLRSSGLILLMIAISGAGTLLLVFLAAIWAGNESDVVALDRQRQLVNGRLHDQVEQVAHEIGLIAAGYDSLQITFPERQLATTPPQLLANNTKAVSHAPAEMFGDVAAAVFGYDAAFLVNSDGNLVLSTSEDTVRRYKWVRPLLMPMLLELHGKEKNAEVSSRYLGDNTLASVIVASGALQVDLMRLEGRPTVVGIIPITPRSGTMRYRQRNAEHNLYFIVFRFLDGETLDALSREQGLIGARFSRSSDQDKNEVAFQIDSTRGHEPIGFVVWTPDLPGSDVIVRLLPALSFAALIIAALFLTMIGKLRRSLIDLRGSEHNARQLSVHDVLTELPNRALFATRFAECRTSTLKDGKAAAVALVDLDRFKSVNDTYGHAVGDELLKMAADRMRSILQSKDTLARFGGDEFAILMPGMGEGDDYMAVCERIVNALGTPFVLAGGKLTATIGCSVGITVLKDHTHDLDQALHYADIALYEAKNLGRGRALLFDPSMDQNMTMKGALTRDLRAVLTHAPNQITARNAGELEVYYQGIHASGQNGKIIGAEALVRWHHPQYGLLTPDRFIPIAEQNGLMDSLGRFVLDKACRAAAIWPSSLTIAVNVSPSQLRCDNFDAVALAILEDVGLEPSRLELELTEATLFDLTPAAKSSLNRLRAAGIRIALDDFGTGFSSLSHVTDFCIDRLKIDRSFVGLLGTRAEGAAVVTAIVNLARTLDIATTAEGIESSEQRDFLNAVGCNEFQGYLFSKPASLSDFMIAMMEEQSPVAFARAD